MKRALCLLSVAWFAACPNGTAGGLDAGGPDAAVTPGDGGVPRDGGGLDAATTDGGTAPTINDVARWLCELSLQGQAEQVRYGAPPDARCSAADLRKDAVLDPDLLEDSTLSCLPTSALTKRYLDALTGDGVVVDADAIEACRDKARALRMSNNTLADVDALAQSLAELVANDADCTSMLIPQRAEGDGCTFGWECPLGTRCEPDPADGADRFCLAPAAFGEACAERSATPVRTCEEGTVCYLDLCVSPRPVGSNCGPDLPPCDASLVCGPAGMCEAPRAVGEVCLQDGHCAEGLFCRANFCAAILDDGAPCNALDRCGNTCSVCRPGADLMPACGPRQAVGGNCGEDDDCRQGLYCDVAASVCAVPGDLGATCDAQHPCGAGLSCSDGSQAVLPDAGAPDASTVPDGGTTFSCQVPPPLGAACGLGSVPCSGGYCAGGLCVAGAEDDPCINDNGCVTGLLCEVGFCVDAPREGAPCTASLRCDDGLYCDGERCRPPPGPGLDCGPANLCAASAYCEEGTCTAKQPAGLPCLDDVECISGICLLTGSCTAGAPEPGTSRESFAWWVVLALFLPALRLRKRD